MDTRRYEATKTRAIGDMILTIRGQKVILDRDLAALYGVPTKVFNQAVKRNIRRFPADFMLQLTAEECEDLRSQSVTSRSASYRSQVATQSHGGRRYLPYAFTEHRAVMAANFIRRQQRSDFKFDKELLCMGD